MKSYVTSLLVAGCLVMMAACDSGAPTESNELETPGASGGRVVSSTGIGIFQPAGDFGGGVLVPGTEFPASAGSFSKLTRTPGFIEYTIQTDGLPTGAYTVWIVVINKPGECLASPCSDVDVFERTAEVDASIFWSAGNVVDTSGKGFFKAHIEKGYFPADVDQIGWPGTGLHNTMGGEFHLIIKYHGLASGDPEVLHEQLYTLLGSCDAGANAYDYGDPFGVQCFDPQVAIHTP